MLALAVRLMSGLRHSVPVSRTRAKGFALCAPRRLRCTYATLSGVRRPAAGIALGSPLALCLRTSVDSLPQLASSDMEGYLPVRLDLVRPVCARGGRSVKSTLTQPRRKVAPGVGQRRTDSCRVCLSHDTTVGADTGRRLDHYDVGPSTGTARTHNRGTPREPSTARQRK